MNAPAPIRVLAPFAAAACLYAALALAAIPNATLLATHNLVAFEGGDAVGRIAWFAHAMRSPDATLWWMPNVFWPRGLATTMQAAGLLKELLGAVAVVLLGIPPWVANNVIHVSTPVTVGLAGFAAARLLLGAGAGFWVPLATGWLVAWTGSWGRLLVVPWLNALEGTVLFLALLTLMRTEDDPARLRRLALGVGVAGGIAAWLCLQNVVHLTLIGAVFLVDQVARRRWEALRWLAAAAGVALLLAGPLMWKVVADFDGDLSVMAGDIRTAAPFTSATVSELLVPPRESVLFGWLTAWTHDNVFHVRAWQASYLGLGVLVLAGVGVASRRPGTGFLLAVAVVAAVFALGPKMALNNSAFADKGLPGPFALLLEAPVFGTMREIRRYAITSQLALGLLAGHGLWWLAEKARAHGRFAVPALALAVVAVQTLDMMPERSDLTRRVRVLHHELQFLDEIAAEPGAFGVLDLPYFPGSHLYLRHGAQHGKGVVSASAGRLPSPEWMDFQRDLRFPGMVIWEEKDDPADFAPFARALADYRVRYIILHEQYIDHAPELRDRIVRIIEDPATWAGQDAVRPPRLAFSDRTMRAWRVEPAGD